MGNTGGKEAFTITDAEKYKSHFNCSRCSGLLNVGPIYTIVDGVQLKTENVCGRCKRYISIYEGKDKINVRQFAYENIARFVNYPCVNSKTGCGEILEWDRVTSHEKECPYQKSSCPIASNSLYPNIECFCNWQGILKEMDGHVEEKHKHLLKNREEVRFSDIKANKLVFTKIDDKLIIVVIKHIEGNQLLSMMWNNISFNTEQFRYRLEFFNENKTSHIILNGHQLQPYTSRLDILADNKNMVEIDIRKIKEIIPEDTIYCKFDVVKKSEDKIKEMTKNDFASTSNKTIDFFDDQTANLFNNSFTGHEAFQKSNPNIVREIYEELNCLVCEEFMTSPIFNCDLGHSICNVCRSKLNNCPSCRSPISKSRNFSLEKLSDKMKLFANV